MIRLSSSSMGWAEPVILLSARARSPRLISCRKVAEMFRSVSYRDLCAPFPRVGVPINTSHTTSVPATHTEISKVFRSGYGAEIAKPIVASTAINVVDVRAWPNTMDKRPNHAMRGESPLVDIANPIPAPRSRKRLRPGPLSVKPLRSFGPAWEPIKPARFSIIAEKIAHLFRCGYRLNNHSVSPHVCGQGRALLTQRYRPVSYGGFTLCSQAGVK